MIQFIEKKQEFEQPNNIYLQWSLEDYVFDPRRETDLLTMARVIGEGM